MDSYSQIKESDPSTWPEPTFDNIRDTSFYNTKKKLLTYYKWKDQWRKENLPNLYIGEDQLEKVKGLFPPFYSIGERQNQKGMHISIDSLYKLNLKDYTWLKQKLEQDQPDSPCLFLQDFFYDIYLVKIDSNHSEAILHKMDCWNSILDKDDATEYEMDRQGDTLIIFKFPEQDNR